MFVPKTRQLLLLLQSKFSLNCSKDWTVNYKFIVYIFTFQCNHSKDWTINHTIYCQMYYYLVNLPQNNIKQWQQELSQYQTGRQPHYILKAASDIYW